MAVAAPYFDHRGTVVGSVGLYGPAARISEEKISEFARHARQAGQKISALLGFQGTINAPHVEATRPAEVAPIKRARKTAKA